MSSRSQAEMRDLPGAVPPDDTSSDTLGRTRRQWIGITPAPSSAGHGATRWAADRAGLIHFSVPWPAKTAGSGCAFAHLQSSTPTRPRDRVAATAGTSQDNQL